MFKGWRTLAFNGLLAVAGIFAYLDMAGLSTILPAKYSWVPIVVGVANIALRVITTSPIGKV